MQWQRATESLFKCKGIRVTEPMRRRGRICRADWKENNEWERVCSCREKRLKQIKIKWTEIQLHSITFLLCVMTPPILSLPSIPTLFWLLFAVRKKKTFKSSRKSKWSTGVIRKQQRKKTASTSSMSSITSSDSSTDGMGGESSSVGHTSSSLSDSSDDDEKIFLKLNRHHQDFKALQKRLKQRCNESSSIPKIKLKSSQPSKSDPIRRKSLTEFYLKKLGVCLSNRDLEKKLDL